MDRRIIEMGIIWVLIIFISILMLSCQKIAREKQVRICFAILITISILSSIRTIGWDIPNYKELYQYYFVPFWDSFHGLESFLNRPYEPLNYFLGLLFGQKGFHLYLLATCAFPLLVVWYISKVYKNPLLFFGSFVLINFATIDQSRQFLASGFTLLSYVLSSLTISFIFLGFTALAHFGSAPAIIIGFAKKRRPSQCNLLFLGIVIFIIGRVLPYVGLDSSLGVLAGRMGGYFQGFFSATNAFRIILYFYLPVTTIIFLTISKTALRTAEAEAEEPFSWRFIQAENSYLVASVIFVSLLLGTGSDVISTRLFSACGVGNFLLIGRYLERSINSKAFVPCMLWLISINVAWSAQYFYGYIS